MHFSKHVTLHAGPCRSLCTVFKTAMVVSNMELALVLRNYIDQKKEQLGSGWQEPAMLKRTTEYLEKVSMVKNAESAREIRRYGS